MPIKMQPKCLICSEVRIFLDDGAEVEKSCNICGTEFGADATCANEHYICHMCRQKAAREDIIAHCRVSGQKQPYSLLMELMQLPKVAMHGPEHHLLLTASLLTAYCNEKGALEDLPEYLAAANERSMAVPGGACGFWGICGAAIGGGIYVSIVTEATPYAEAEWKTAGQLTARCANAISREGGPRCCKRDCFLSLLNAVQYSNAVLDTHFEAPGDLRCEYYPNNEECKGLACPFFPARK